MATAKAMPIPFLKRLIEEVNPYGGMTTFTAIWFHAINANNRILSGTPCKEVIGYACVQNAYLRTLIKLPKYMPVANIRKLQRFINDKEDMVGVKHTKFYRVRGEGRKNWIVMKYSPRWTSNSAGFSLLTTWVRLKIKKLLNLAHKKKDQVQLDEAYWVVDAVEKYGLNILGVIAHKNYDYGMVGLQRALSRGDFKRAKDRTRSDERKGVRYHPIREMYLEYSS